MRNAVTVLVLASSTLALAEPSQDPKPTPVDIKSVVDKLEAYKDDLGNFYVVPKQDAFKEPDEEQKWLFYGDGKQMYRQRIIGFSVQGNERDWIMWGPRAQGVGAELFVARDKQSVQCKVREEGKRTTSRAMMTACTTTSTSCSTAKATGFLSVPRVVSSSSR